MVWRIFFVAMRYGLARRLRVCANVMDICGAVRRSIAISSLSFVVSTPGLIIVCRWLFSNYLCLIERLLSRHLSIDRRTSKVRTPFLFARTACSSHPLPSDPFYFSRPLLFLFFTLSLSLFHFSVSRSFFSFVCFICFAAL